jgi:hypothetical protein
MHPPKRSTTTKKGVAQAKRTDEEAWTRDGAVRPIRIWHAKNANDDREWTHVSARDGDVEFTIAVRGRFDISKKGVDAIADRLYAFANDNYDVLVDQGLIRIEWVSNR